MQDEIGGNGEKKLDIKALIAKAVGSEQVRIDAALDKARTEGRAALTPEDEQRVLEELFRLMAAEEQRIRNEPPLTKEELDAIIAAAEIEYKQGQEARALERDAMLHKEIPDRIADTFPQFASYFLSTTRMSQPQKVGKRILVPEAILFKNWDERKAATVRMSQTAAKSIGDILKKHSGEVKDKTAGFSDTQKKAMRTEMVAAVQQVVKSEFLRLNLLVSLYGITLADGITEHDITGYLDSVMPGFTVADDTV
jgi:hypothetical protein